MKEKIVIAFESYFENFYNRIPEVTVGLIALLIAIFLGIFFRKVISNRLRKRMKDTLLVNFIGRSIFIFFLIIGFVICLNQIGLGQAAGGLLAGAGVSALILGFAFKDIGENFIAGFFLAFSRPFSTGDIIEVNGFVGNVKSMSFRNCHIRTFDGRDIFIPNSMMIKNPLINYTKDGLMRHDFIVGIDYGDDIAEASQLIMSKLKSIENIVHGNQELEPMVIIDKFGTSTINLKVFFWINTFDFLGSNTTIKSMVMQHVIKALLKGGFTLPADIVELKIYQEGQPIPLSIKNEEGQKPTKN